MGKSQSVDHIGAKLNTRFIRNKVLAQASKGEEEVDCDDIVRLVVGQPGLLVGPTVGFLSPLLERY